MSRTDGPGRRVGAVIWRIGWALLMVVAAFAAISLELDREARRQPGFAHLVPSPMRHFAQFVIASRALSVADDERVLTEARRLVSRRPVPAENLSLLALAFEENGLRELSGRAIALSAGRGWREPLAQRAIADLAMDFGEWETAFFRTIALWSLGYRGDETIRALDRISGTEAGQRAFARWMKDSARWRDDYLDWGGANLNPERHARIVMLARQAGTSFSCKALNGAARSMLTRGAVRSAEAIWSGSCARRLASGMDDIVFAPRESGGKTSPFGWDASPNASFSSLGNGAPEHWRLEYDNPRPGYRRIADAFAGLAPGSYRASIAAIQEAGAADLPLQLRMRCVTLDGQRQLAATVPLGADPSPIAIPASACTAQHFELMAPRGSGTASDLRLTPTRNSVGPGVEASR